MAKKTHAGCPQIQLGKSPSIHPLLQHSTNQHLPSFLYWLRPSQKMNPNDTIINTNIIMTPSPTSMGSNSQRRFRRHRDHMAHQPRSVSLRDFGKDLDTPPATPPSTSKSHPICGANPPEVPRHERPINRRLFLQEAQDRLSLPDLFAPRTPTALSRRGVRALPQRPSLLPIQPRMGSWDDCFDAAQSHNMSQRNFFSGMNPADF